MHIDVSSKKKTYLLQPKRITVLKSISESQGVYNYLNTYNSAKYTDICELNPVNLKITTLHFMLISFNFFENRTLSFEVTKAFCLFVANSYLYLIN